ncbi:DUF6470 family protein [Paenibacillus chitinolyticus]|uniref:DUF6470 family protein n=1 Tax=Paenibacillus chitinolyticus TaxID=79263 RepID=UPI002DB78671|nr:DUF6470 family protein [Paenibacillus chitinolyticus]MEC0244666.1 DUF6470 family protein [Paenibacillus chitinolyticus]
MQIPRIQISQQYTKIGLSTTEGKLSIEQPKAELNLQQDNPKVSMETEKSNLEIDSTRAWSALGSSKLIEMRDLIAQSAFDISMQNIAEIAQNGDRMMEITNHSNAFADIARQNAFKDRPVQVTAEPSYDNVDINYAPSVIHSTVQDGKITFDPKLSSPRIQYEAGKLEAYVTQKNAISFSVVGGNWDASI